MNIRNTLVGLLVTLLIVSTASAQKLARPSVDKHAPSTAMMPESRDIQLETTDGVEIAATYYAPGKQDDPKSKARAPVAILVHMYPADRSSWRALVPVLHQSGFAVLAYDIRGTGGSNKDEKLRRGYSDRDPEVFQNAWRDAEAAAEWLEAQPGVNADQTAMIGASIGCSISLEYGSRNRNVRGIVCLSPGTNYFGVDSVKHIAACGQTPVLLIAPEGERSASEELARHGEHVTVQIHPGTKAQHGTRMFDAEYGPRLIEFISRFALDCCTKTESGADRGEMKPEEQKGEPKKPADKKKE